MVSKGRRSKLTLEIKAFIDTQIRSNKALDYSKLRKEIAQKYGVHISKPTISKRVKALKLEVRRGRKRLIPVGKKPAHAIFLDCAGAFFLKGAELETGFLTTMNQLLATRTDSVRARKALKLAQQINALLLYAPVFDLDKVADIAAYQRRGLLYLTEQTGKPSQEEIEQYLQYLADQKLLPLIVKEVAKTLAEALLVQVDFAKQTFYLDAQCRTVWPNTKVLRYFSTSLSKPRSYVKSIFQFPSPQRPLILQTAPGYTFLPPEMFSLIHCFEEVREKPISRLVILGNSGEILEDSQDIKPGQRCFFIVPLSPWQYPQLQGTEILSEYRQYRIGPEKEPMAVADAQISLFNPQLNANIGLRAVLIRRKRERIALITNISRREERYAKKIAEQYFFRWPAEKIPTYYDLLEEAHGEVLARSRSLTYITPLLTIRYGQTPLHVFKLFLECLNHYARSHFFPSEYETEDLKSMQEKFYQQSGYLKIKQHCWEVILQPFSQEKLQKDARIACRRFNQSGIKFPSQSQLRIYLQ